MNFLAISFLALTVVGADEKLTPSVRLESGGKAESVYLCATGRR